MKTRILTSVLVAIFAVSTAFAGNPKTNVYKNIEYRDNGYTKEFITVTDEMKPETKAVYEYTANDIMLEKTTYKWNTEKGWVSIQKYTYEYNERGELASLIFTEYNKNGELLSAKLVDINNDGRLIAVK